MDNNKLIVTAAPHITSTDTTQKIMQRRHQRPDPGGCDRGGLRLL